MRKRIKRLKVKSYTPRSSFFDILFFIEAVLVFFMIFLLCILSTVYIICSTFQCLF